MKVVDYIILPAILLIQSSGLASNQYYLWYHDGQWTHDQANADIQGTATIDCRSRFELTIEWQFGDGDILVIDSYDISEHFLFREVRHADRQLSNFLIYRDTVILSQSDRSQDFTIFPPIYAETSTEMQRFTSLCN